MFSKNHQHAKFIRAVKYKDYQTTEDLLKKGGFNINKQYVQPVQDSNVLHWAAHKGNAKMAELLLANKADVNLPTKASSVRPIHYAAMSGSVATIILLLNYKAEINKADQIGRTALHLAVINNRVEATELLIKSGSDVNSVNSMGRSALHWAAFWGRPECALLLLQHGIDANLVDINGDTALTMAEKCYKTSTADVIKSFLHNRDTKPVTHVSSAKSATEEVTEKSNTVKAATGGDAVEEDDVTHKENNVTQTDDVTENVVPQKSLSDNTCIKQVVTSENGAQYKNIPSGYTPVIALVSPDQSHVIVPQLDQGQSLSFVQGQSSSSAIGYTYKQDHDDNSTWIIPSHFLADNCLNAKDIGVVQSGRPSEMELNRLAGQIGYEWSAIALGLGISLKEVEQFEMAYPRDPRRQILSMLIKWRNTSQNMIEAERCELLKVALEEEGRKDLSNTL